MEIKTVIQRVRNIVRSLSSSNDEVEDISQEAMLKILKTKSPAREISHKWLYSVARNCFVDAFRKRAREAEFVSHDYFVDSCGIVRYGEDNEYHNVIPFPTSDYLPHYKDPEFMEKTNKILQSLPFPLEQVLTLHTEGLAYQEIADEIGIKIGTVRSRLHRAKKLAREIFASM